MDQRLDDLDPRLARALEELERRASASAARLDPERMAATVVERLRQPEVVARPWWRRPALRVAAAIAVLAIGVVTARAVLQTPGNQEVATLPVTVDGGLDSLEASAAESLLAAVDQVQQVQDDEPPAPGAPTLDDLTESELRALLQALESTEGTDL